MVVIAMVVIAMIVTAVDLGRRVGLADGRTSRVLTTQRGNQKREEQSEQWEICEMTHTEPVRIRKLRTETKCITYDDTSNANELQLRFPDKVWAAMRLVTEY